jgi:hypothetical protein
MHDSRSLKDHSADVVEGGVQKISGDGNLRAVGSFSATGLTLSVVVAVSFFHFDQVANLVSQIALG